MKQVTAEDIEIRAIKRAFDELKCLDPEGRMRALDWLRDRFIADEAAGRAAREASARERIARRGVPTTSTLERK